MVRKMMKLRRRPITVATEGRPALVEPWLDWQIRTMSAAGQTIRKNESCIGDLLAIERRSWASQLGRFGTGPRENHLVNRIMLWRNLALEGDPDP